jgi:hypothetical protein
MKSIRGQTNNTIVRQLYKVRVFENSGRIKVLRRMRLKTEIIMPVTVPPETPFAYLKHHFGLLVAVEKGR